MSFRGRSRAKRSLNKRKESETTRVTPPEKRRRADTLTKDDIPSIVKAVLDALPSSSATATRAATPTSPPDITGTSSQLPSATSLDRNSPLNEDNQNQELGE